MRTRQESVELMRLQITEAMMRLHEQVGPAATTVSAVAPVMTKIYRDLDAMPAFVRENLANDERLRVAALATGFRARGRRARRLEAALAHALHVRTWESLCLAGGLSDAEAVDLMTATVLAAVTPAS